ncbi:MAG TPA: hypothetical protein VGF95_12245 [Solirubrobacteraceae bacterium]|jgi:hypothetical protein
MQRFNYLAFLGSRFARRAVPVGCVAVAAVAGTITIAASANGSSGKRTHKPGFSVFAHPLTGGAHTASVGGMQPPPGSVLAATHGNHYAYASRTGGEVCVIALRPSGGGAACGASAKMEETGADLIALPVNGSKLGVTLLVPNGVSNVQVADNDGSTRSVVVANNVVIIEEEELASVQYTLPWGVTKTIEVGSIVKSQMERIAAREAASGQEAQ